MGRYVDRYRHLVFFLHKESVFATSQNICSRVRMNTLFLQTEEIYFLSKTQRLAATKIYSSKSRKPNILALHGLGINATRNNIRYILDYLAEHGYASMCFDYSGNGDSTGLLEESCLRLRWQETLSAADQLSKEKSPILIGTSMGGHLAAWVTPVLRPQSLILFCPSTYSKSAIDLKFDKNFERPSNYADSLAYSGIREFNGDLLIIAAKNDQVVHSKVIEGYLANAQQARSKKIFWLDDCDHYIHRWLPYQDILKSDVLNAILNMVSSSELASYLPLSLEQEYAEIPHGEI